MEGNFTLEAAFVTDPASDASNERTTQFIKLLTSHQSQIYSYIAAALFGDPAVADVLQETNLHLWAQANRYDFDRPFLPWAFGFARQRVMAHRKKCSRTRLVFCDKSLDLLANHCLKASDSVDDRLAALQMCLKRLNNDHADLIRERYTSKTSVQSIADRMNESAHNISSRLHRIRKILANCIEQAIATEGR